MIISRESSKKGKKIIVLRNEGKIIAKTVDKGQDLKQLKVRFQEHGTFTKNTTKYANVSYKFNKKPTQSNLSNFFLNRTDKSPFKQIAQTRARFPMYEVSGNVKGKLITARSQRVGHPESMISSKTKAVREAWENFFRRVNHELGFSYEVDFDEEKAGSISGITEGWVYFT